MRPGVVAIQTPTRVDPSDPWSRSALETRDIFVNAVDAAGRRLVPEPRRPRVKAGDFVASYVNYDVCNGAAIAGPFGDKDAEREARATLARLYPGREAATLDVDAIGGGIHGATQQKPEA